MTAGTLSEILNSDDLGRPVLVNFQNGTLAANKLAELKCGLYTNKEESLTANVASNKTVYSGNIFRNDDLHNNFILIRNKKSGKCKLIMIDKALLSSVTKGKRKLDIDSIPKTKKITDLNRYFGSKRTKMITEQNERLKVDVENIKETLEQTAKETHIAELDVVPFKPDENDNLYRPPINRNASKVQDIYPLHVLIPSEILEELKQSSQEMLDDSGELTLCDFVKDEFIKLQRSESSERVTKAQILLYIDCLVSFLKQPARMVGVKKFSSCPYSSTVNKYLLDSFTLMSASGRTRPLSMRDKCVCYILVLSMLAFNNAINLEIFTKDLKLGIKKLQDISKVLGFSFKGGDKKIATLSLPLPQPVVASTGKKRR
ncbi:hypothetical protein Trydic_g4569 [Trypoxylus dichotomus]